MENQKTIALSHASPRVSVVIPARNEQANLERCLRSLVVQRGIPFEIIVVDDGSTDRTREIAESYTRARSCPFLAENVDLLEVSVVSAREPLPEGWTGKLNACQSGANAARGEWLLFTDADTEHLERSLASALAEAEEHSSSMLSYSPEQVLTGAEQHALMPLVFAELATVYKPREVSDPGSRSAAANGQYILIRQSVLDHVGGFQSIAGSMLEDVALAKSVKAAGEKLRFRMGRGLVRTYMYQDAAAMHAGWIKNLALLFKHPRRLASLRLVEFFLLTLLPVFAVLSALAHRPTIAFGEAAVALAVWIAFQLRVSRAHFGAAASLFSVFGLPIFAMLLLRSASVYENGSIVWKGRIYQGSVTSEAAAQSNDASNRKTAGNSP
jgi:cellulose synthase/poly-beta-1,6-N-acetylglucosamine synthase-like glycosyltransferase